MIWHSGKNITPPLWLDLQEMPATHHTIDISEKAGEGQEGRYYPRTFIYSRQLMMELHAALELRRMVDTRHTIKRLYCEDFDGDQDIRWITIQPPAPSPASSSPKTALMAKLGITVQDKPHRKIYHHTSKVEHYHQHSQVKPAGWDNRVRR